MKWKHPLPSLAIAWNCEYYGNQQAFLLCVTFWHWNVLFSWSKR